MNVVKGRTVAVITFTVLRLLPKDDTRELVPGLLVAVRMW